MQDSAFGSSHGAFLRKPGHVPPDEADDPLRARPRCARPPPPAAAALLPVARAQACSARVLRRRSPLSLPPALTPARPPAVQAAEVHVLRGLRAARPAGRDQLRSGAAV